MLYLFSGTDVERSRARFRKLTNDLRAKRPEAGVFVFTTEGFNEESFRELLGAGVLFGSRALVLLNKVFADKVLVEMLTEQIEAMADSENVFLVLEEKLLAPQRKKFEKYAKEIYESELKQEPDKKIEFNIFSFSDAIGNKAPKDAWVILQQAVQAGIAPEELFWKAVWQVKMMAVASASDLASSGLKPFVYGKAQRAAGNYGKGEVTTLHRKLLALYHDTRRGTRDFAVGFERLVLDL